MNEIRKQVARVEPSRGAVAPWTAAKLVRDMEQYGEAAAIMTIRAGRSESWSYRELAETVGFVAAGLREAGLTEGEPVALLAPNGPEWIAVALALNAVGALLVPLDDLADDERTSSVLATSGAKWIFTTRAHVAALRRLPQAGSFRIYLLDPAEEPEPSTTSWLRLRAEARSRLPDTSPAQPACLFYTSGTTGPPKAFVLTHANLGANVLALASEGIVWRGDRALVPLPLHHAYPYVVGILTSLQAGVTILLPQSITGLDIAQALQVGRATVIVGVPRLYEALLTGLTARIAARGRGLKHLFISLLAVCRWAHRRLGLAIGRWLLASIRKQVGPELRLLVSGGAKLDAELSWTLETMGWQVLAGYGLAETASVFTANLPRHKRLGSAGVSLGDGSIRIAHADEKGIGEIELRGSNITSGYCDNPDADKAALTGDGWFRTGDLGYVDEDGFLFVTGRAKEVIVLGGGKKVNPEDLEKKYAANPLLVEIAVLEHRGQIVGLVRPAAEQLSQIGTFDAEHAVRVALTEVGQNLPPYERLAGFAIAPRPLPRTRLGKYQRFLLPRLYEDARTGVRETPRPELSAEDRQLLSNPIAAAAWKLISARYEVRHPTFESHLALDLGVDSLEWMSLSLELEAKLGLHFSQDAARVETIRDLLHALTKAGAEPRAREPRRAQDILADRERWLRPRGLLLGLIGVLLLGLNRIAFRLLFRLRVQGLEHLPPKGPFLLAPNHVSDLDPLAIAAALSFGRLRRVYWAGDVTRLFRNRVLRLLCRAVHLFPVDEHRPDSATEMASFVLSRGNIQVWFPEGWRSPDGRLQRFRPGVGTLLAKTAALAVPVYVSGAFEAMPRTRHWPRLHPIRVLVGAPLSPGALAARGVGESAEERMANALQAEVRALAATIGEHV
jgi:long-chain acyl-CoA synthetase